MKITGIGFQFIEHLRSLTTNHAWSAAYSRAVGRVRGSDRAFGWMSYFRLTEVRGVLQELDGWIRRKLRCLLWRQWKRPATRNRKLQAAGLNEMRAWKSAGNGRGPWWNAGASHMNVTHPKRYFDALGLVSLLDTQQRFQHV